MKLLNYFIYPISAGHNLVLIDKCLELGCSLGQMDQVGSTPMKLAEGRKYYDVIRWFQVRFVL